MRDRTLLSSFKSIVNAPATLAGPSIVTSSALVGTLSEDQLVVVDHMPLVAPSQNTDADRAGKAALKPTATAARSLGAALRHGRTGEFDMMVDFGFMARGLAAGLGVMAVLILGGGPVAESLIRGGSD
jgi:hypothetical protein